MKKKQTYIIGGEPVKQTPKKKIQIDIQAPKPKKKPVQKSKKPITNRPKTPHSINNAFADAFAKVGLTANDFKKKS